METRICSACGQEKSIAGVWYLLASSHGTFMCSSCFMDDRQSPPARARS